eukprot:Partr_v1_DN27934_c1_g1_i3_m11504 putative Checkpoint kinase 2
MLLHRSYGWQVLRHRHVSSHLLSIAYGDLPNSHLGRHRTADIRIDGNMTVSNRHCSIFQYANMLFLRDTSANGTFVNGKLVGRDCKTLLHHNDHIEIVQNEEYFIYQEYSILRHQRKEREMMLFEKYFLLDKVVGRGSFGLVRIGVNKSTGRRLACKQIKFDCNKIKERQRHHIEQEIAILTKIDHPNLIRVWDIIEVHGCVSIFMDLVEGGDLLGYIESRGNVAEEYARFGFFQLLQALRYLHEINVSHRDLKPENVLVENCSSNYTRLIVTDFGLAKAGLDHTNLKTFCGTMGYIAPEVLTPTADGYTIAVDCWSLGVVLYSMLAGYFPFPDHSDVALTQAVRNGLYDFKAPVWNSVT